MRRVLVPLDGSALAESIIPDARRMAGADGELILVYDQCPASERQWSTRAGRHADSDPDAYLATIVRLLREEGVQAQARTIYFSDVPMGIDAAAEIFGCDVIACATHGRTAVGRLVWGGAAWQAVAKSSVPVLLRHLNSDTGNGVEPAKRRRIMVPLDGSENAEQALPLARQLADEWHASLLLVRVVPILPQSTYAAVAMVADYDEELRACRAYLDTLAGTLGPNVDVQVELGGVVDHLTTTAEKGGITDVVMTSRGRTGLPRAFLGSIADELVHRLHLPIVVIPARALDALKEHSDRDQPAGVPAST